MDEQKATEIHQRREKRRYEKWSTAFDKVVTASVTAEIASAIYSDKGQFDLKSMEMALERQETLKNFPNEQKKMLADLGEKLKKCLSTVIDEEVPQELIDQQQEEQAQSTMNKGNTESLHYQFSKIIEDDVDNSVIQVSEYINDEERHQLEVLQQSINDLVIQMKKEI